MPNHSALHQLGSFIVGFQAIEAAILEFLELISASDCELVRIVANDLEYSKKVKALDVGYARMSQIVGNSDKQHRDSFHSLMVELDKLGTRRNDLVHSFYHHWVDEHGKHGLLRENSRLKGSAGIREEIEEKLQPDAFVVDLDKLRAACYRLEEFRRQYISWLYPDVEG